MGATESIFYDEDPPIDQEGSSPVAHREAHDVRNRPSNGGPRVARRPQKRTRPRPGGPTDVPIKTMQGLILGLPSSGKRTLLERLKGKDPFDRPQDGENDTSNPPERNVALVPYQAPAGVSVWDRIQLKVQTTAEVNLEGNINFCVVLINPSGDPSQIQKYLIQVISELIKRYEIASQEWQANNNTGAQLSPPLCICFLVSFRDLYNKKNRGIQEADVKQCVHEIFQQLAERLPSADQILLEFGTTSLYNCYGLATLHHFIYAAYLRTKRNELEQQLSLVQTALSKPLGAPRTKYKDFLKIVESTAAVSPQSEPTNDSQQPTNGHHDKYRQSQAEADNQQGQQSESKRKILSKEQPQDAPAPVPPTYANAKQALEEFLASDDEDEVVAAKPTGARTPLYSSDDDDDDFFYNEAGERCTAHPAKPKQAKPMPVKDSKQKLSSAEVSSILAQVESAKHDVEKRSKDSSSAHAAKLAPKQSGDQETARTPPSLNDAKGAEAKAADQDESRKFPEPEHEELEENEETSEVERRANNSKSIEEGHACVDNDSSKGSSAEPHKDAGSQEVSEKDHEEAEGKDCLNQSGISKDEEDDAAPANSPKDVANNESSKEPPSVAGNVEQSPTDHSSPIRSSDEEEPIPAADSLGSEENAVNDVDQEDPKKEEATLATNADSPNQKTASASDSEDEDEFFIGDSPNERVTDAVESKEDETSHAAEISSIPDAGNDSDDDEFFIGGDHGVEDTPVVADKAEEEPPGTEEATDRETEVIDQPSFAKDESDEQHPDELPPVPTSSKREDGGSPKQPEPPTTGKPSLSAAAQAAIAAAQKEAELMLQQSMAQPTSTDKAEKKAKKKKDKEAKKEKKKSKEAKKEKKAKRKDQVG